MMTVHLNTGEKLTASLVIGADGRQSQVRNAVNIGIKGWSYGQTAVVLSVDHDKSHEGIAYEHFQPGGPFAILPMYNDAGESKRAAIVWTEKDTLAQALIAADDATFRAEFTKRFGTFLGDFDFVGPRFSYPLSLQFADRYVAHRVALVGDAAHGMHPVAGQGMNMGVRDVAAMVECLVEAYRLGQDLGAPHILEKYQSLRRSDNLLMLGLTDALVRLFSNDIPPIALARRLGMHALQHMIGPKKFFMKHAMGMVGTPPKMMRGEPL
jgi:2-octaprenyl-6-methoxyphenol hydroxylase